MTEFCKICCWNDSYEVFDDDDYSDPPLFSPMYLIKKLNGYNWVVNPNCYNHVDVCYECLLERIYCCNLEIKYNSTKEIKIYYLVLQLIKNKNIPNEIFRNIYKYIS